MTAEETREGAPDIPSTVLVTAVTEAVQDASRWSIEDVVRHYRAGVVSVAPGRVVTA